MMKLITSSCMLEWLILMPVSFSVLRFILSPGPALLLSGLLCILSLAANLLCRCKLKGYQYKSISLVASVLLAFLFTGSRPAALITAALFIVVFLWEESCYDKKDTGVPVAILGLLFNIFFALLNTLPVSKNWSACGNAAIFVSIVTSVILLIVKQVDDSRRFGNKFMGISTTQRKNNILFGGMTIVLVIALGAVGQVSVLYTMVLNLFLKLFWIVSSIFTLTPVENAQLPAETTQSWMETLPAEEPSLFTMIVNAVLYAMGAALVLALAGLGVYLLSKFVVRLVKSLIHWLNHEQERTLRIYESGHVDEKESLYTRNLKKLVGKLEDTARHLLNRAQPYEKLPDKKAKIRRLFKYYTINVQKAGVKTTTSSTASEICRKASDIQPQEDPFHRMMKDCYNAARYGDLEPSEKNLNQLESKLLK